jgi:hypothetical protein
MNGVEKEGICGVNARVVCLAAGDQLFNPGETLFHLFQFILYGLTSCGPIIALIKEQRDVAFTYDDTIQVFCQPKEQLLSKTWVNA